MATIDIGKIKPVFKGTYDNSTAYVLDDIVYYNGSSYVAKTSTTGNLPTDTTKWNILASGSGGIWSSSLSLGTAGQVVKVNSGATALEFGADEGGKILQVISSTDTTNRSTTASNWTFLSGMPEVTITPASTSNKILVHVSFGTGEINGGEAYMGVWRDSTNLNSSGFVRMQHSGNYRFPLGHTTFLDTPNSTSALVYQMRIFNSTGNNFSHGENVPKTLTCMEIAG